ncbi:hypothetical protein ABB37_03313 [Leptomonas pyrrhocoris]|uniref:Uncharacterized protein n=1 Tax=Leptomonas pyrrhocoris TaxID=157538 RepID=A0A0N0DWU1_LEPPY|nr:hypothetical protein ABB37_03313 [Leptomonas pyrrhocoris]KPA82191.1 hypothetical protein ABB37_03313 [Leptomonas pyrrhocoris]|eukprot:XP_015660630.1 hypothetical protein ABB37_03313 [Leptomonas pyrrhocoris]
MFSWLWETVFGDEVEEHDDTVAVSMAELRTISEDILNLRRSIEDAQESLAAAEENTKLFYQSIESLLMETYDAMSDHAELSPETTELQAMRAALEDQRAVIMETMVTQKDDVEARLFRSEMQLLLLEQQKTSLEASARHLDVPSVHIGHVTFPAPVATEYCSSTEESK